MSVAVTDLFGAVIAGGFMSAILTGVGELAAACFSHKWHFFMAFHSVGVSMVSSYQKWKVLCSHEQGTQRAEFWGRGWNWKLQSINRVQWTENWVQRTGTDVRAQWQQESWHGSNRALITKWRGPGEPSENLREPWIAGGTEWCRIARREQTLLRTGTYLGRDPAGPWHLWEAQSHYSNSTAPTSLSSHLLIPTHHRYHTLWWQRQYAPCPLPPSPPTC